MQSGHKMTLIDLEIIATMYFIGRQSQHDCQDRDYESRYDDIHLQQNRSIFSKIGRNIPCK